MQREVIPSAATIEDRFTGIRGPVNTLAVLLLTALDLVKENLELAGSTIAICLCPEALVQHIIERFVERWLTLFPIWLGLAQETSTAKSKKVTCPLKFSEIFAKSWKEVPKQCDSEYLISNSFMSFFFRMI